MDKPFTVFRDALSPEGYGPTMTVLTRIPGKDHIAMGKSPVTGDQWLLYQLFSDYVVAEGDHVHPADTKPVVSVTWDEATAYCMWLSRATGFHYRLPTGFEWEYASQTKCPLTSDDGHFRGTSTIEVGDYAPTDFGLYDMHGNAWEWCADRWSKDSCHRLIRGGAWSTLRDHVTGIGDVIIPADTLRQYTAGDVPRGDVGFRVVRVIS